MLIRLTLDYWSDGVLCLDPEKVLVKLKQVFPTLEADLTDWAEREVQQLAERLQPSDASDATKETMLRQIRGKQRRNGPVYHFRIPQTNEPELTGMVSRYGMHLRAAGELASERQAQIVALLESFGAGRVSIEG